MLQAVAYGGSRVPVWVDLAVHRQDAATRKIDIQDYFSR